MREANATSAQLLHGLHKLAAAVNTNGSTDSEAHVIHLIQLDIAVH